MLVLTLKRQARGWTKSELARRARMTPGDIGKIESGRLKPYRSQLRKLARALSVAVAESESLMAESAMATPGESSNGGDQ